MPSIEVTELDFEKAQQQIALLEDMVSDYQMRNGDHTATIAALESDIAEIKEEARQYDYLLNPRPKPEICTLCNGHPEVKMPSKPCPNCGCLLVNAQPLNDKVNWIVPGQPNGSAMDPGKVPV